MPGQAGFAGYPALTPGSPGQAQIVAWPVHFWPVLSLQREEYGQYSLKLGLTLTQMSTLLEHLGKTEQAKEYREWSRRLHE